MESKIENCLYMQVAHCNKCGGQSGYNIVDGEKVCFDCGEPYEADFSVSKVESTITTTNSQDQEEENTVCEGCGKTITSRFMQSYTKGDGMHSYCLSCDPEKQDTPEEWEEKQRNLIEKAQEKYSDFRRREQLLSEDVEIYKNTREYVEKELVEDIINFTKQLLEERECRAREEGTFTKEELEGIGELLGFMESDYPSSYWKPVYDKIKLKLTTK